MDIIPSLPDFQVVDEEHYWDFVTFSVQGHLFRVPKYRFIEESEYFCKEYDLDFTVDKEYGVEDPHIDAIQLNIDVNDFRAFLKVLYPRKGGSDTSLVLDQWKAVLRLSSKWFFNDIRQRAIASIAAIDIPLLERIEMAKEHHVSAWLLRGYRKLVVRSESITVEEAEKMDSRKAILVCGLREKYHRRGYCQSEIVLTTFASDFDEVRAMEVKYPTKEERKVMEAKRVKVRAEEEAKALARCASMMEEETRRQAALEEYERQLEEQREVLSRLEKEKEQILLNGPLPCSAEPQAAAVPFENGDTVEDCVFRVPGYQLIQGSEFFSEKYSLNDASNDSAATRVLEDVTAEGFRTFLKLLFPRHSKSTTLEFTKAEWLTILSLSTLWHFHDLRKLAIEHLDSNMKDPVELVQIGRKAYVLDWVTRGYSGLVLKPEAISEEESEDVGHRSAVRLYIIRHALVQAGLGSFNSRSTDAELTFVETELRDRFHEEYGELRAMQKMHRTNEEIELEEREPEAEGKAREAEETQDRAHMQDHEGGGQVGRTSSLKADEQAVDPKQLVPELEDGLEEYMKAEDEHGEEEKRQEQAQDAEKKRAELAANQQRVFAKLMYRLMVDG